MPLPALLLKDKTFDMHAISMKANISFGIGLFIAVAAFYVILTSLPLVFQNIDGPMNSIEPELTTTTSISEEIYTPETPDVISKNGTAGIKKPSTPLQKPSQKYGPTDQAVQQAEQQLEQEIESVIDNQTAEEITDLITGAAAEGL